MPRKTTAPAMAEVAAITKKKQPSSRQSERSPSENQERAYVAASRRSDRSLELRVKSAHDASKVHFERTGKYLRITEEIVRNEEMYEEVDNRLTRVTSQELREIMPGLSGDTVMGQRLMDAARTTMALRGGPDPDHANRINELFKKEFPNLTMNRHISPEYMAGYGPPIHTGLPYGQATHSAYQQAGYQQSYSPHPPVPSSISPTQLDLDRTQAQQANARVADPTARSPVSAMQPSAGTLQSPTWLLDELSPSMAQRTPSYPVSMQFQGSPHSQASSVPAHFMQPGSGHASQHGEQGQTALFDAAGSPVLNRRDAHYAAGVPTEQGISVIHSPLAHQRSKSICVPDPRQNRRNYDAYSGQQEAASAMSQSGNSTSSVLQAPRFGQTPATRHHSIAGLANAEQFNPAHQVPMTAPLRSAGLMSGVESSQFGSSHTSPLDLVSPHNPGSHPRIPSTGFSRGVSQQLATVSVPRLHDAPTPKRRKTDGSKKQARAPIQPKELATEQSAPEVPRISAANNAIEDPPKTKQPAVELVDDWFDEPVFSDEQTPSVDAVAAAADEDKQEESPAGNQQEEPQAPQNQYDPQNLVLEDREFLDLFGNGQYDDFEMNNTDDNNDDMFGFFNFPASQQTDPDSGDLFPSAQSPGNETTAEGS